MRAQVVVEAEEPGPGQADPGQLPALGWQIVRQHVEVRSQIHGPEGNDDGRLWVGGQQLLVVVVLEDDVGVTAEAVVLRSLDVRWW